VDLCFSPILPEQIHEKYDTYSKGILYGSVGGFVLTARKIDRLDRHKPDIVPPLPGPQQYVRFSLKPVIQDMDCFHDLTVIKPETAL